uniref:Uncharacterized protein n=1 Tax=Oryza meridionalis TaxID=40149 RepID=A0A0E0ENX2_9ORYZ
MAISAARRNAFVAVPFPNHRRHHPCIQATSSEAATFRRINGGDLGTGAGRRRRPHSDLTLTLEGQSQVGRESSRIEPAAEKKSRGPRARGSTAGCPGYINTRGQKLIEMVTTEVFLA